MGQAPEKRRVHRKVNTVPDATRDRPRRTEWICAAVVAVISLLFHLLYFRHGVQNLVDLGVACVDADRLLNGQVPGQDFLDPYGPARFYITALAFSIGGKSILTFSVVCRAETTYFRAKNCGNRQGWL